jgi:hypothetical protein
MGNTICGRPKKILVDVGIRKERYDLEEDLESIHTTELNISQCISEFDIQVVNDLFTEMLRPPKTDSVRCLKICQHRAAVFIPLQDSSDYNKLRLFTAWRLQSIKSNRRN